MPDVTWADDFFPTLLRSSIIPLDVKSVLDVGCGRGMLGCLLRIYREPERLVAIDAYKPYLEFVKKMGAYDTVLDLDLSEAKLPFKDKEFDIVLCLEVIEHLQKEVGLKLLGELERVGRRVVISTPGVFFPQPRYDGNVQQSHISFYGVRDFEVRGYSVYGVGELVVFGRLVPVVSNILSKLTFWFPRISGTILAVKDVGS